ncbi:hypothetical protein DZC75_10510 [Pseudomonas parafulva]|uniref:Uncharacterized protein n=1 Tax=Pseudomonas parafulva TaxID=157782 RepID=A0AAI8PA05_9PSED|nr:hypothetical protein DZC75_10510 [Pseudomonas parafulva]
MREKPVENHRFAKKMFIAIRWIYQKVSLSRILKQGLYLVFMKCALITRQPVPSIFLASNA